MVYIVLYCVLNHNSTFFSVKKKGNLNKICAHGIRKNILDTKMAARSVSY